MNWTGCSELLASEEDLQARPWGLRDFRLLDPSGTTYESPSGELLRPAATTHRRSSG